MARVRLGPRLVDLPPCFFPFNPNVVALAGRLAVRIVALEPLLSGLVVHQVSGLGMCSWATNAGERRCAILDGAISMSAKAL